MRGATGEDSGIWGLGGILKWQPERLLPQVDRCSGVVDVAVCFNGLRSSVSVPKL